jgi:hypothetical protein
VKTPPSNYGKQTETSRKKDSKLMKSSSAEIDGAEDGTGAAETVQQLGSMDAGWAPTTPNGYEEVRCQIIEWRL